ncbi:MAG: T9SS type A sorting domain-containing protein [Bacteroidetes bacterium]|nr:T9SS type A sorting domain-containing protein [Bacteroidota bacterium]
MNISTRFLSVLLCAVFFSATLHAQILQRGTATNATTTNATLSINKPTGVVAGDVLIVNIAQAGPSGGNVLSNPTSSGWTLVAGSDLAGGTRRWGAVLYKVAGASEPASYSFTLDADGNSGAGSIVAFSGVDATGGFLVGGGAGGPFDVAPGSLTVSNATTASASAITTATANAAVIMFAQEAGSGSTNTTFSSWTIGGSISPFNELYDNGTTSGDDAAVGAAWGIKASPGSTGSGSVSLNPDDRSGAIILALKVTPPPPAVTLSPSATQSIAVGGSVNFTATALNYTGSGNYTFTWTAAGATIPGSNPNSIAGSTDTKSLTFPTAGTYTVSVTIARTGSSTLTTSTTTVNVYNAPAAPNLWATSSDGNQVSTFSVTNGVYFAGPTNLFDPFPSSTETTAALGRNDKPSAALGFFYWMPNDGAGGVMNLYAANSTGGSRTLIGTLDVNGSSTNNLGFVRLGMGPDGTGWILAGDGTTLYLAKFTSNGVNPVTITLEDASVALVGGTAGTFQNGDICVSGTGNLYALANDGSGVTQIFTGFPSGSSTTLTKKWDLVDASNAPFTGTVNGVAFDLLGSLYISTGTGLYFIDQTTANSTAATVACSLVFAVTGLQDLASNVFPTNTTLPLHLISFSGSYRNNSATLNWEAENLQNFSHFELERSSNGTNYSSIASKQPAGDPAVRSAYQYADDLNAVSGKSFYYRLKMVDNDGKFTYSNIILIRKEDKAISDLRINPNPIISGTATTVRFDASARAQIEFRVVDLNGRIVLTQRNNVTEGTNSVALLNLERLQPGMYVLQMLNGNEKQTVKFNIAR